MGHATKSFVVFTGGEWSEQLHGRTDLAKADSAGRKVRNFVPAQTGRLSRRKGLEFVGSALGECLLVDPRFEIPSWEGLDEAEEIDPPISEYGNLGPEELRTSEPTGPVWQMCDFIAYCDGPVTEGATMTGYEDRYLTRWMAKLEDGNIYYRRVGTGEEWTQVPGTLIPQPNLNMIGLGFCFDANARPCFASQIGANIYVWRWQADVPMEYDFPGTGPRLVFNGILQSDNAYWDVMCYFCWLGDVVTTFQRENFQINHTLFTSEDYYFTRVKVVERGTGDSSERLHISAIGSGGVHGLLRSPLYNPWPFSVLDQGKQSIAIDGIDYFRAITECGIYVERATQPIAIESIAYDALTVEIDQPTEPATQAIAVEAIAYTQAVIQMGTYSDGVRKAIAIEEIVYPVISVNAGTYSNAATQAIAIEGINYATA